MDNQKSHHSRKNGQVVVALLLVMAFLFLLGMWGNSSTAASVKQPVKATAYFDTSLPQFQTGSLTVSSTIYLPLMRLDPTPIPPTATPTPIYRDDFSNGNSGWLGGTGPDKDWCKYEYAVVDGNNGVFRISVTDERQDSNDRSIAVNFGVPQTKNGEFTVRVRRTSSNSRRVHYGFYFGAGKDAARNHWFLQVHPIEVDDCNGSDRPYFWLTGIDDHNNDGDLKDDRIQACSFFGRPRITLYVFISFEFMVNF